MGVTYLKKFAQAIEKLRLAVGDSVDILIDFHGRTYSATAVQYINAIGEFKPFFCEEPVPPENVAALREVRRAVRVPIATGEWLVTPYQFREIFGQQAFSPTSAAVAACWKAKKSLPWLRPTT